MQFEEKIHIVLDVSPTLEGYFDENLINIVVRNALMNAFKFAKSKIRLRAFEERNFLYISIEDDGPGFPPSLLGELTQTLSSIDVTKMSTGLGFYFSYQVAKLHTVVEEIGLISLNKMADNKDNYTAQFLMTLPKP